MAEPAVPARDVERLYGLPLADFTHARDATARRLRRAGEREAAEAAGSLRKPSIAAWTVNQLVRHERRGLDALVRAADALRAAMASGDAQALARASRDQAEALQDLVERARELLEEAGERPSEATLERVAETLRAAA